MCAADNIPEEESTVAEKECILVNTMDVFFTTIGQKDESPNVVKAHINLRIYDNGEVCGATILGSVAGWEYSVDGTWDCNGTAIQYAQSGVLNGKHVRYFVRGIYDQQNGMILGNWFYDEHAIFHVGPIILLPHIDANIRSSNVMDVLWQKCNTLYQGHEKVNGKVRVALDTHFASDKDLLYELKSVTPQEEEKSNVILVIAVQNGWNLYFCVTNKRVGNDELFWLNCKENLEVV